MCFDQTRHNNEGGVRPQLTTMNGYEEKNERCMKKKKEEEKVSRASLGIYISDSPPLRCRIIFFKKKKRLTRLKNVFISKLS